MMRWWLAASGVCVVDPMDCRLGERSSSCSVVRNAPEGDNLRGGQLPAGYEVARPAAQEQPSRAATSLATRIIGNSNHGFWPAGRLPLQIEVCFPLERNRGSIALTFKAGVFVRIVVVRAT